MSSREPWPPLSPIAGQEVFDQIKRLNLLGDTLIAKSEEAIGGLTTLTFSTPDFSLGSLWSEESLEALADELGTIPDFGATSDWLAQLDLSAGNADFAFNPAIMNLLSQPLPNYVVGAAPSLPTFPDAPADPGTLPPLTPPSLPTFVAYEVPSTDVGESAPVYSDFTSGIISPTLRAITLPPVPVLALDAITFTATPPTFTGTLPDPAQFVFNGAEYVPLLINETKAAILSIFNGGTGVPAAVQEALFERAREQEIELGERDVDQATNEFAAKGYKYPAGAAVRRIDRARKEASKKVSALNREQFIEVYKIQIVQFNEALGQAVALENIWSQQFITAERLRFEAAQSLLNFSFQLFSVLVTKFNAEASMFQIQAEVYKTRIEVEVAKVNAYAEQINAQKLIGEINTQDVQIYAERVRALLTNAEIYKARVEGYTAKFAAVDAKIKIFEAELGSNKTLSDIYDSQTRGFGSLVQAQVAYDQRYSIKADIYTKQIEAKKIETDVALSLYDANFKLAELQRETYVANSQRLTELIAAESGRISALVAKYQAIASEIGAKGEVERARYSYLLSYAQAQIARMQAAADILTKQGEINLTSGLTAAGLVLRAHETAATTLAQLAAGFTSAASVSASISQASNSGIGYSYSGQLDIN